MRGITGWHYHPFRPANMQDEALLPFICRLAPGYDNIGLEWFDAGSPDGTHLLQYRLKGSDSQWQSVKACTADLLISGLISDRDYELRIIRANAGEAPGQSSRIRYARTGAVPGKVVNYLHPEDELFAFSGRAICSPSIIKLKSGSLLASMDVFAPAAPQNLTFLFRSNNRGESWNYVTDLFPCYWGTLFIHRDRLYMLGCSTEYGDLLIGASDDEGCSWTVPSRLFSGSSSPLSPGWQRTPTPILNSHGRLFFSVDFGAWREGGHSIGTLSVPEDADLLDSSNWTCSGLTGYDPEWPGAPAGKSRGLLEGNMLPGRDGKILNLLRVQIDKCDPGSGLAVILEVDPDQPEAAPLFHKIVKMPSGSNSKSHVLFDERSRQYIAIGNICVDPASPSQRTVLALQASEDLYAWRIIEILLDYRSEDPKQVGFQYISFIFDDDDILYLSRTSYNKARNFHDANYITFHTAKDFRRLLK